MVQRSPTHLNSSASVLYACCIAGCARSLATRVQFAPTQRSCRTCTLGGNTTTTARSRTGLRSRRRLRCTRTTPAPTCTSCAAFSSTASCISAPRGQSPRATGCACAMSPTPTFRPRPAPPGSKRPRSSQARRTARGVELNGFEDAGRGAATEYCSIVAH